MADCLQTEFPKYQRNRRDNEELMLDASKESKKCAALFQFDCNLWVMLVLELIYNQIKVSLFDCFTVNQDFLAEF